MAAFARELNFIQGADVPKRAELAIEAAFERIPFSGVETGDYGCNRRSVQEFEDTDVLVTLLDVEPMHELSDDDGAALALGYLDIVEVGPLAGNLGVKRQQGA